MGRRTATATDVGLDLDGVVDESAVDPADAAQEAEENQGASLSTRWVPPRMGLVILGCRPWPPPLSWDPVARKWTWKEWDAKQCKWVCPFCHGRPLAWTTYCAHPNCHRSGVDGRLAVQRGRRGAAIDVRERRADRTRKDLAGGVG